MLDKKYRKYQKPNVFLRDYSFTGEMGIGEFWSEVAVRLVSFLCACIVLCIALVVIVPGEVEQLSRIMDFAVPILAVFWSIPIIAMSRRRLRDGGYDAKSYLWLLLPVIGWVIFLARLFAKSK